MSNPEQRCHYCGFFLPGHYDNCQTVKPTWRGEELPLPAISAEERQRQAAKMADLICQLIKEMGGLPSTAHGVAAALCKALEERKENHGRPQT